MVQASTSGSSSAPIALAASETNLKVQSKKDKVSKKNGRTPEEQAARDARKAAKDAAAAASSSTVAELGESTQPAVDPGAAEAEAEASGSKRKRPTEETGDELEIDVGAPAPLSKAELRANKKKLKRGEVVSDAKREYEKVAGSEDKDKKEEKEKEKEVKRQNSIWIGNLSFKTTEESLKEFILKGLQDLGTTSVDDAVTRVNLPKKTGKFHTENKGFAYVDFATPELQALGVGLSEKFFEGRRVLIKRGDDHASTPNARTPKPITLHASEIKVVSKHPESSSLYMGNLPFDATELGIRDLIEGNAPSENERTKEEALKDEGADSIGERGGVLSGLKKVRLGAFEDTGRCKGFAFLDFISSRHAKVALSTRKNHFFGGRRLTLEFASEEAVKRGGGRIKPKLDNKDKPRKFYEQPISTSTSTEGDYHASGEGAADGEGDGSERKNDKRGKKWEVSGRPRPGAALAMAKRENVAIVKGQGEKITFD